MGTVRSKTTTVLSSKTMGNILAVHVREGDHVRTGQLLIEIDDRDSQGPASEGPGRASRGAGRPGGDRAEHTCCRICKGSGGGREESLALATFNRYKALLDQKSVSQQEFDEVQAKLKVAEAEVDRAGRMLQALLAKKNQVLAKHGTGEGRYHQRPGLCWLWPDSLSDGWDRYIQTG